MKKINYLLLCCFLSITLFSQQNDSDLIRCYTTEHEQELRVKYPNIPSVEEFEEWFQPQIEKYQKSVAENPEKGNMTIIIPCVVHVLHNGGEENISDAQVLSQIDVLNEDFQRIADSRGAETTSIGGHDYNTITAPMNIEFRMALTGPNGELTDGINRVDIGEEFGITGGATRDELEETIKPGTIWDANFYLNLWTVNFKAPDQNLLGYAQFPFGSGLEGMESADNVADTDGVVQSYRAFGTLDQDDGSFIMSTTYGLGRTATHEVGHWVGLRHIWGDGLCLAGVGAGCACLADDFCDDTPNSGQPNSDCSGTELSTCPDRIGPDMVENYMDYSADACMNIFTNDQIARIMTVLDVSPRRKELKQSLTYLPPGNFVQFAETSSTVTEGTSCNAREMNIAVNALGTPTADITVTLGIKAGDGTATDGVWEDYILVTTDLVIPQGDATGNVIIELFEDSEIESAEDFTIELLSVTGGDAELGQTNLEHRVLIQDDDVEPLNAGSDANAVIFSETFESDSPTLNEWTQDGSALFISWGTGAATNGLPTESAYVQDLFGAYSYSPQSPNATIRYDSPEFNANGASDMTLTFDYMVNGESGGDSDYDYGTVWYSIDGGDWTRLSPLRLLEQETVATKSMALPPEANNANAIQIGFQWQNDEYFGNDVPLSFDNIIVTGSRGGASPIATLTTPAVTEAYVRAGDKVHFYDADGNVMATIENADMDLGCTSVEVISDGEAANITLTDSGDDIEAASKLFTITSDLNTNTANYDLTLYYTKTEVDNWIADLAANTSPITVVESDFKLLKSSDADVSTATGIIFYDPTTQDTYDANGTLGYSFTGNFTGFSTFGGANVENELVVTLVDSQNVTCNGGMDGFIELEAQGVANAALVTYAWGNGITDTDEKIENLSAGTYPVTVTDPIIGEFIGSFEVTEPDAIEISFNLTEATCEAADGTATAIVANETHNDYTINWSNTTTSTQDAPTVVGLTAGDYTAQVTDGNSCMSAQVPFTIISNSGNLVVDGTVSDVACAGDDSGDIILNITGQSNPISVMWSNGATTTNLENVTAGAYEAIVTDANGCVASKIFIVSEPNLLTAAVESTPPSSCNASDGTARVMPDGGISPYSFVWNDDVNSEGTEAMRSDLESGEYTVTVSDQNDCMYIGSVSIAFISDCSDPLAVELLNFNAQLNARNDVVLTWHTEHEENFSHYEVLRMDATQRWDRLDNVVAQKSIHNDYDFMDKNVAKLYRPGSTVYYQLRMVNIDGSFNLSAVKSVKLSTSTDVWAVYPNPTETEVNVVLNTNQVTPATLNIFSIEGKLQQTMVIDNPNLTTQTSLNINDLNTGIYLIELQLAQETRQLKLVVK